MTLIRERCERAYVAPRHADETDETAGPFVVEPRRPVVSRLGDRLSPRWVGVLAGAWLIVFSLGVALEPTPAPAAQGAASIVETVFGIALLSSWIGAASGFVQRRRYGALASLGGAACLVMATVACPLSGHHLQIGNWWWFQVAGSLTLLGLSRKALTSH
ncbi:MAG: hypothetical protein ACRDV9_03165 [Acidimicrobiia bacterium]